MSANKSVSIYEWRELMERMTRLERLAEQAVIVPGGGGSSARYVVIGGGNTLLPASIAGIKYSSSAVTEYPSGTAPSDEPTGLTDGLGWGRLLKGDGSLGDHVWIVNDTNTSTSLHALIADTRFPAFLGPDTVTLSESGGGSGTAVAYQVRLI